MCAEKTNLRSSQLAKNEKGVLDIKPKYISRSNKFNLSSTNLRLKI